MNRKKSSIWEGIPCLAIILLLFGGIGYVMGVSQMLNTLMNTAHDLLLNTVFYLMGVTVLTGAIGKLFIEFGVVNLLEKILRPLMRPLFNLPGVASLGAVMTFLSDNPAIISLAQDKRFSSYFKKYQFISLTNFGTAFGMGLLVIVFMMGQGFFAEPVFGLFGAFVGCITSTRLMQRAVIKAYPHYAEELACAESVKEMEEQKEEDKSLFIRILNSLLDGGRTGVDVGFAIIPGVLIISSFVMLLTFGASADGTYTGSAYEGVELLPWLASKVSFLFEWLFGFTDPHLIGRRQRHSCIHRNRHVLEWLFEHPHRNARLSWLSRTDIKSNRCTHHRRFGCCNCGTLALCVVHTFINFSYICVISRMTTGYEPKTAHLRE